MSDSARKNLALAGAVAALLAWLNDVLGIFSDRVTTWLTGGAVATQMILAVG